MVARAVPPFQAKITLSDWKGTSGRKWDPATLPDSLEVSKRPWEGFEPSIERFPHRVPQPPMLTKLHHQGHVVRLAARRARHLKAFSGGQCRACLISSKLGKVPGFGATHLYRTTPLSSTTKIALLAETYPSTPPRPFQTTP